MRLAEAAVAVALAFAPAHCAALAGQDGTQKQRGGVLEELGCAKVADGACSNDMLGEDSLSMVQRRKTPFETDEPHGAKPPAAAGDLAQSRHLLGVGLDQKDDDMRGKDTALSETRVDISEVDAAYLAVERARLQRQDPSQLLQLSGDDKPMVPWMSTAEREFFYALLGNATFYHEFGSGGSTVAAAKHANIKSIFSHESDKEWVKELKSRDDLQTPIKSGRLHLEYVDIGPVGDWGNPVDNSGKERYPLYSDLSGDPTEFDMIFVDGRFRVACALKALQHFDAGDKRRVLVMHDYTVRQQYHVIEEFVDVVKSVDTLTVFQKKTAIDDRALRDAIGKYVDVKF